MYAQTIELRMINSKADRDLETFDATPHLLMSLFEGSNFAHFVKDNLWPVFSVLSEMLEAGFTADNQVLLVPGPRDSVVRGFSVVWRELWATVTSPTPQFLTDGTLAATSCFRNLLIGFGCRSTMCIPKPRSVKDLEIGVERVDGDHPSPNIIRLACSPYQT